MSDLKYTIYGKIQYIYHGLRGRNKKSSYQIYYANKLININSIFDENCLINGRPFSETDLLFKGDNIVEGIQLIESKQKVLRPQISVKGLNAEDRWLQCIKSAKVENGWKNSGFYLTAYTKESKQWCLSNWIWTSAAIARVLSEVGLKKDAQDISDTFIKEQLPQGGWVVRYDFIDGHLNRLVAPNDSAYIARNSLLTTYKDTGNVKYLKSAEKCAEWIMETSWDDGLVLFGYNVDLQSWITDRNIVDIGFTADLFAELYKLTGEKKYKDFMNKFITSFINTFYDTNAKLFSSHVNRDRKRNGGYFSRGQAWAMEGLVAAYSVSKDEKIRLILDDVALTIVENQLKDGGWHCNFQKARALMGEDCKGISVIAKSLLEWAQYSNYRDKLYNAAKKALVWCENHTDRETGVILSFSCNGAIAHSFNTRTGILYANAYAIEVAELLQK